MTDTTNSPSSRKAVSISGTMLYDASSRRTSQDDPKAIVTNTDETDVDQLEYQKPAYVAVCLIMAMTAVYVVLPMLITSSSFGLSSDKSGSGNTLPCLDPCRVSMVESIPENLTYSGSSPVYPSTYSAWSHLITSAQKSIDIAAFYWTLRGADIHQDPSDWQGEMIFKGLLDAGKNRSIKIRIAQNQPSAEQPSNDSEILRKEGGASVRNVDFLRLLKSSGVLHTKIWVVDGKHVYIGSANMDWRSLTQVKELGIVISNCSCLAADMAKLFDVYWYLGLPNATIPKKWPKEFTTKYNKETPLNLKLNSTPANIYLSSSPPPFCAQGRTDDLSAIINIIDSAKYYVYIAVMDYFPAIIYSDPNRYWPDIDDALRRAAFNRRVRIRLLASWWNHTRSDMKHYLRSLHALDYARGANIQVRLFHVPAFTEAQKNIPFARVNHNKYMVTDSVAYIGTSNWSGDYFISTAGIGLVVNQTMSEGGGTVQQQLKDVFNRDWTSNYSCNISEVTCTG